MYRLKVLTDRNLAARTIGAQATEIAIRARAQSHDLAGPPSVHPYRVNS